MHKPAQRDIYLSIRTGILKSKFFAPYVYIHPEQLNLHNFLREDDNEDDDDDTDF